MAEVGFYIDTGAQDAPEEQEQVKVQEQEVLGGQQEAQERMQRERAQEERGLASFPFGKVKETVEVGENGSDEEESDDGEEVDEDLEDGDLEVDSE